MVDAGYTFPNATSTCQLLQSCNMNPKLNKEVIVC